MKQFFCMIAGHNRPSQHFRYQYIIADGSGRELSFRGRDRRTSRNRKVFGYLGI
jgi:hypothetical protein